MPLAQALASGPIAAVGSRQRRESAHQIYG
jgi:hypothetical protein